ncbi:MAG TPA: PAS domain S-box protein [Mucilaginibacter sp.]
MTLSNDSSNTSKQAIKEQEGRFRALVTATSDIVYVMSPDWTIMQQLDGRGFLSDTSEPITNWLDKYIYPADRPIVNAAITEAIKAKKIFQLEHRVMRADGTPGWTLSRAVPIMNEHGEITEWFGAASDITEQRRTQEALRQSTEQAEQQKRLYETITDSTPDLIYVFDLNYRFTYANKSLLAMWGKTWDTAIGKGLRENGYEEWHAQMHEREIDQVRTTKSPIRGEVSFPHAKLGRRIYDYIFTPVLNEQGDVEAVAGTTRDITEIRIAEKAISESEQRFRTLAEGTDILIAVGDENGAASYFNSAWVNATGRSVSELVKSGWTDLIHPDDKKQALASFRAALQKTNSFGWEFRMADPSGQYRWWMLKGVPRFHNDGTFAGYISSCVDIDARKTTERKLYELNDELAAMNEEISSTNEELRATNEELAESERKLQQLLDELRLGYEHGAKLVAIVESSDDAIIGKNLEGIVTSWNRGAEQVFGYTEAEMIGKSILTVIPEDRQHEEPMILGRLRNGEKIDHYETIRQRADGSLINVSLTISPIKDKEGRVIGVSKIARDITEQKRNEQRKNDFIAMASHELKTPLTSLTALIQMVQQKLRDSAEPFVSQALARANMQAKRMTSLINGFLNVSRLESGKLDIKKQTFDLSELVASEVEEVRLTASNYVFTLVADEALTVLADKEKIASVITNLLTNAVKYSLKNKIITVRCVAHNGEALVSVEDKGVGIKATDLPRVFDRYYRAEGEHMKQVSGFGVGLYLSAEVIRHHGGQIWAESEADQGSTFYFTLPLQDK